MLIRSLITSRPLLHFLLLKFNLSLFLFLFHDVKGPMKHFLDKTHFKRKHFVQFVSNFTTKIKKQTQNLVD